MSNVMPITKFTLFVPAIVPARFASFEPMMRFDDPLGFKNDVITGYHIAMASAVLVRVRS
jgi:hypothetical protein